MFKCNEQRTINFGTPEVWTEGRKIIIRKTNPFKGVVELTHKEAEKVLSEIAIELMKKQDQSRKSCPCCGAQLE